jgi:uncharacterized protein (TIGR03000 family)
MTRPLVVVALLSFSAGASAQVDLPLPPGPTAFVGPPLLAGYVVHDFPITNGPSALYPARMLVRDRFSVGGGSMSAPPQVYLPSGSWSTLQYPWPVYPVYIEYPPAPAPVMRGRGLAAFAPPVSAIPSNATLVVQFPADAEVWVGGKKDAGKPVTEWTLTAPPPDPSGEHKFEVKGRWKSGGKTFEASRSVTVRAGARNRLLVVSGTEVTERPALSWWVPGGQAFQAIEPGGTDR